MVALLIGVPMEVHILGKFVTIFLGHLLETELGVGPVGFLHLDSK